MNLADIASAIGGEIVKGDTSLTITSLADPVDAVPGTLTFLFDMSYLDQVVSSEASAVITREKLTCDKAQIVVDKPRMALAKLATRFNTRSVAPIAGPVHVDASAVVPDSVQMGAFVSIGKNVVIGENCHIHSGVVIGDNCVLGDSVTLYPSVTLYDAVHLGNEVVIHSGAIVGADGFGYEPDADGQHQLIPQIGGVTIGNSVHIGALTTIDRGTLRNTVVGDGTKIDNQVQIGHNCIIGKCCIIVAQVGVTGSVTVGDYSLIAGQAGVSANLGEHVTVGALSGVTAPVADNQFVSGFPAKPHRDQLKEQAILRRIVRTYKK